MSYSAIPMGVFRGAPPAINLNGDGATDIVVGAPGESAGGGVEESGAVYVFLGGHGDNAPMGIRDTTEHDFRIFGNVPGGRVGTTLAAADVNGDSYDDIVVGAPNLQGVFVVFG